MSKALRGSGAERPSKVPTLAKNTPETPIHKSIKAPTSKTSSPAHTSSPKNSPSRSQNQKIKTDNKYSIGANSTTGGASDEQWIDGPRISKSKVAEARYFMKEPCHVKKRETWVDGPMKNESSATNNTNIVAHSSSNVASSAASANAGYGYMDSHKKNMIRKWVEHQTSQIVKSKHGHQQPQGKSQENKNSKEPFKELTQFKTYEEEEVVKPLDTLRKQEVVEESTIRTGLKLSSGKTNDILECQTPEERDDRVSSRNEVSDFFFTLF